MLTKEERIFALKTFYKSGATPVINEWNEHFNSNPSSRLTAYEINLNNMDLLRMHQDLAAKEQPKQRNMNYVDMLKNHWYQNS